MLSVLLFVRRGNVIPMALLLLNERMTDCTANAVGIRNRGLG